jgi:hypothetical protein
VRGIAATWCRHVNLMSSNRQALRDLGVSCRRSEFGRGVAFCSPTDSIRRRQGLTFERPELLIGFVERRSVREFPSDSWFP